MKVPVFIQQNGDGWTAYALIPTPTPLHDAFGYVGIGPLSVGQGQTPHEAKKNLKTAITGRLDGILDEIEI